MKLMKNTSRNLDLLHRCISHRLLKHCTKKEKTAQNGITFLLKTRCVQKSHGKQDDEIDIFIEDRIHNIGCRMKQERLAERKVLCYFFF